MDNELSVVLITNLQEANKKLDILMGKMNQGAKTTDKLVTSVENLKRAFNFSAVWLGLKKTFAYVNKGVNEINKYSETLNMFNLVMGDMEKTANKFQKTMATNFGNNNQEQLYYQSLYQSLTESMGMQEKYAYIISENMTKLAYDLSSLYDKEQKDVAEALRSGLIGQTKPVRAFGLDITEASLQPILDNLGIDRTVRELSQAEKEIVRYLALIRQSVIAHGDMANTIESPANQLRILKNQLVECHRWFGALFINLFAKALPYINAVVMAITEVMKALGSLFGIEIQDYNSSLVSYEEELGDYIDEVGDSADSTSKKIKELRREILKFDQINNINEDNDSSSGSSGGFATSGGIDQRLLDALTGYENGMEKVRMKALDIKKTILDWLGFLLDGEKIVGYSLPKFLRNLKNKWQDLNTEQKIFVGLGVGTVIALIGDKVIKLTKLLGNTGLFKAVATVLSPLKDLVFALSGEGLKGLGTWASTLTTMETLSMALLGTGGVLYGFSKASDGAKEFAKEGQVTEKVVGDLAVSLLASASGGALLGASFGPVGMAIGAVLGTVATLTGYLSGLKVASNEATQSIIEQAKSQYELDIAISNTRDKLYESSKAKLEEHTNNEKLLNSLRDLVDANGKVKEGYETRVAFILNELNDAYGTNYKLIQGQITENGKEIKSLDDLINKTKELIEIKKAEILLDKLKDNYADKLLKEKQYYIDYTNAKKRLTEAQKEYNKVYEQYYEKAKSNGATDHEAMMFASEMATKHYPKLAEAVQNCAETVQSSKEVWESATKDIQLYEDLQKATVEQNSEAIKTAISNVTDRYTETSNDRIQTLSEELQYAIQYNNDMKKNFSETGDEINRHLYEDSQEALNNLIVSLNAQTNTVESLTPEIVEAWDTLAEKSYDEYIKEIEKLNPSIKDELLRKQTATLKQVTPETVQAWQNLANSDKEAFDKKINELPDDIRTQLIPQLNTTGTDSGKELAKSIGEGAKKETKKASFWDSLRSAFGGVGKFINGLFSGINIPLSFSVSSGNLTTPKYASGGFPEDGFFYANHHELVGQFSNGKTAVANNEQITEGIKRAVVQGMSQALRNSGYSNIKLDIRQDEGIIVKTAIEGINNITKQTGENPIELW